jgi:hypothetical protein
MSTFIRLDDRFDSDCWSYDQSWPVISSGIGDYYTRIPAFNCYNHLPSAKDSSFQMVVNRSQFLSIFTTIVEVQKRRLETG